MSIEAMKQALEALEIGWSPKYVNGVDAREKGMKAITSLRQAIAEAEKQEPVAKVCHDLEGHIGWNPNLTELPDEGTELYTTLQIAKPKQEHGESVAWMAVSKSGNARFTDSLMAAKELTEYGWAITPLYTTPQQRKPLNQKQLNQLIKDAGYDDGHGQNEKILDFINGIAFAEAAHGIKGK